MNTLTSPAESARHYEYAFEPVDQAHRKPAHGLLFVVLGFFMALSCFVTGAKLGAALPLGVALTASATGNLLLLILMAVMGIIAFETGWSITFLSRRVFGAWGSVVFSILFMMANINWIGSNGNLFSKMVVTFQPGWPLPSAVTVLLAIGLWSVFSAGGWRWLERFSKILVPAIILCMGAMLVILFRNTNGFTPAQGFQPTGSLPFTAGVAAVVGNFICGGITIPDSCRFAKSRRTVLAIAGAAVGLGMFLPNICGILIARCSGTADFLRGANSMDTELLLPVFLCGSFCLWTTQMNNVYSASLAVQNIFKNTRLEGNISHQLINSVVTGLAATAAPIFAVYNMTAFLQYVAIVVAPVPGLIVGEYFFIKQSKEHIRFNWAAMLAWGIGILAGYFTLSIPFLVAPAVGLLVSFGTYVAWSKSAVGLESVLQENVTKM